MIKFNKTITNLFPPTTHKKAMSIKKIFLLLSVALSQSVSSFAQDIDSITFVKAKWSKEKIAPKTKLIIHHFNEKNLFLANQNISFIEIDNKGKHPVFGIAADSKTLKPTAVFGKENQAIAALNGTFFDVKNGGSVDFVKVDGTVINQTRLEKESARARHQKAAILISDGKLSITKWDNTPNWEQNISAPNVMLSGPLLTFNQKDETLDTSAFNRLRHPRSAIGIKPDGKIILLTVDGRHDNSAGLSLFELTKVMRWLGCTTSINLDGGGSTTLWISSKTINGNVNYPSDNKKWDHEGERKVANVIYLKK